MKENENMQNSLQENSLSTSKKGRKRVEKIEVEKIEVAEEVKEVKKEAPKSTRWIMNPNHTKTCEACGAIMFGWAFREPFEYCPKCGAKAE